MEDIIRGKIRLHSQLNLLENVYSFPSKSIILLYIHGNRVRGSGLQVIVLYNRNSFTDLLLYNIII